MKIRVIVLQKPATVNPPDKVVGDALRQMRYSAVGGVRLGRYLEFEFDESLPETDRRRAVADMCRNVKLNLVNPIMEEFAII